MNFKFRPLELPPVPQPKAQALIDLVNGTGESGPIAPPQLPPDVPNYQATMPRSIDDILADIEKGAGEQVTILEWVYLFYAKEDWDRQQGSDRVRSTSRAIWKFAQSNLVIAAQLFWRLAVYYSLYDPNQIDRPYEPQRLKSESFLQSTIKDNGETPENSNKYRKYSDRFALPQSLVDCFNEFVSDLKGNKSLTVEILVSFSELKGRETIISLCFEESIKSPESIKPKDLLIKAGLPPDICPMDANLFRAMIREFNSKASEINATNPPNPNLASLLISCLEDMAKDPQLNGVDYLLKKVPKEIAGQFPNMVNWVKHNYGSTAPDSRWNELSLKAKIAFQNWIGALNYGYFMRLVNLLLVKLDIHGGERNQLERRRDFWSNYSDRFERIRVLLPQSSQKAIIGSEFEHQDISLLDEDGSSPTEVCIFDFGDCCIVEFFRGTGSETRVFDSRVYPNIKTQLFDAPQLSLKRLRYLEGEVHDHKYLWQAYCEELLRNRNIYANEGTEYFKGLNLKHSQYNRKTGLQKPSPEKQEARKIELKRWETDMKEIKEAARHFCERA